MRIRTLWRFLTVVAVLVIAPAAWAKNYLVIILDDVAVDKIASYAGDFPGYTPTYLPQTRTIDTLAARGLRFTHAWATPLCSPTRAAFQSGRQPSVTGVGTVLERGAPDLDTTLFTTIANRFAAQGYATGLFGKYHIGTTDAAGVSGQPTAPTFTVRPHPSLAGWDRFFGNYNGYLGTGPGLGYFNWNRVGWIGGATGSGTTGVETTHATDRTEQIALQWINGRTTPWLAVVAFNAAHAATNAGGTWDYADVDPTQVRSTVSLACLATVGSCPDINRQAYQGLVEHMDLQIEALLSGMTPAQRSDTLVVLFGDNGSPAAVEESVFSVAGRGKESTYENGVRVPLIVADASAWATGTPGATIPLIGRDIDLNTNTLDVFNTLHTDAFVLPVPVPVPTRPLDSRSFAACFTTNDPTCGLGKVYSYTETFASNAGPDGAQIAVAYGTDTMVACYKPAPDLCMKETFYDGSTDPLQTTPKSWPGIRAQRLRDYFTTFHTALVDWAHTSTTAAVVPFCAATVAACL